MLVEPEAYPGVAYSAQFNQYAIPLPEGNQSQTRQGYDQVDTINDADLQLQS